MLIRFHPENGNRPSLPGFEADRRYEIPACKIDHALSRAARISFRDKKGLLQSFSHSPIGIDQFEPPTVEGSKSFQPGR